ncbi:MAG: PspC domain-containing protein [Schaedlerella sp.]|nr:PspC domain-containing protein [Lachnospiraceae bacterium]MDY4203466.1 PspC domain-containing protein [Schaedlerella sp.]
MKKLYRSRSNRMLCGVCGGVGEYFNIDATLVRLGMVLLSVFSLGTGLIAYFAASVIVPDEP